MGTRGLTAVVAGGNYKIAQYGQWDHYPDGQGVTALEFCRKHLSTEAEQASFRAKLDHARFVTDEEIEAAYRAVGVTGEWLTLEQSARFHERFPLLSRDHGAKILARVNGANGPIELQDSSSFAGDSLFCEWAYVVDLDLGTLEVFRGFNEAPLAPDERFAGVKTDGKYYPVRLVAKFKLDDLPSEEDFLGKFKEDEAA